MRDPAGKLRVSRLLAVCAAIVVAGALALFFLFFTRSPSAAIAAFARAWEQHDWPGMDDMTGADGRLAATFAQAHDRLGISDTRIRVVSSAAGIASLRVSHTLAGVGGWSYETKATLHRSLRRWSIVWNPSLLHPSLRPGLRLDRRVEWPKRAAIIGRGDTPLTLEGTVVSVGLEPRRIRNREDTLAALEQKLGLDPADVTRKLERPGTRPDWFVPLIDLREERYGRMRAELAPIPGVVFRRVPARVTATEGFAHHVIGRVGEITADRLRELGPLYRIGDTVGLSGLESVFERRLAGSPAVEIVIVDRTGKTVTTLHRVRKIAPRVVRTTIDRDVQAAAEDALADVERAAAIVALDATTGEIRAAASRPLDEPFNRALAGRYPPGSTFKIVTSAALLADGVSADANVTCPKEVTVGRSFRNFEGRAQGEISFRTAFVESCNTAFVRLASRLERRELADTAQSFGFGASYDLSLSVAGGRFPLPDTDAEFASAAIGQGRVVASPLHLASVVGAVVSGTWRPPRLVADAAAGAAARPLDPQVASTIRDWMYGVVAEGTGRAAAVSGQRVAGKTGTAEFGVGDPPDAHAWFVGFRETLAFAVIVEGGGPGGEFAAPVAARFVESLG